MIITPEMLAALPPELQEEMNRKVRALMADLGVKPKVTPDGQRVYAIEDVAAALGMSLDEAMAIAGESGSVRTIDPATLGDEQ